MDFIWESCHLEANPSWTPFTRHQYLQYKNKTAKWWHSNTTLIFRLEHFLIILSQRWVSGALCDSMNVTAKTLNFRVTLMKKLCWMQISHIWQIQSSVSDCRIPCCASYFMTLSKKYKQYWNDELMNQQQLCVHVSYQKWQNNLVLLHKCDNLLLFTFTNGFRQTVAYLAYFTFICRLLQAPGAVIITQYKQCIKSMWKWK